MLMGFGHRVYKNYDPRARIIQKTCHEVLEELDLKDDKLFKLAMALEKSRWKTTTSSSASSTRMSTSIRASFTRRWESPCRSSQLFSRWRARWAGSRSGTKCSVILTRSSTVRGNCSPGRPCAISCRSKSGRRRKSYSPQRTQRTRRESNGAVRASTLHRWTWCMGCLVDCLMCAKRIVFLRVLCVLRGHL